MATKKSSSKGSSKSKSASKSKSSGRKPNMAFMKPMQIDEALSKIVGNKPLPRTEIAKKVWAYIKKHGLQDSKNRRQINADENLRPIFKKDSVTMFEMTKLINKHLS